MLVYQQFYSVSVRFSPVRYLRFCFGALTASRAVTYCTNIDTLTVACGGDHKLVEQGSTTRNAETAKPSGSRQHTWITDNQEPPASITPRRSRWRTKAKTTREPWRSDSAGGPIVVWGYLGLFAQAELVAQNRHRQQPDREVDQRREALGGEVHHRAEQREQQRGVA